MKALMLSPDTRMTTSMKSSLLMKLPIRACFPWRIRDVTLSLLLWNSCTFNLGLCGLHACGGESDHVDLLSWHCLLRIEQAVVMQVLDALKSKGIAIRVASPKLVMEEAPESYKVPPGDHKTPGLGLFCVCGQ